MGSEMCIRDSPGVAWTYTVLFRTFDTSSYVRHFQCSPHAILQNWRSQCLGRVHGNRYKYNLSILGRYPSNSKKLCPSKLLFCSYSFLGLKRLIHRYHTLICNYALRIEIHLSHQEAQFPWSNIHNGSSFGSTLVCAFAFHPPRFVTSLTYERIAGLGVSWTKLSYPTILPSTNLYPCP